MPRYFFDVFQDGHASRDNEGDECADLAAVRVEAMHTLPQIAFDKIPTDGDRQSFVIIARDEAGRAVYSATLSYVGLQIVSDD